MTEQWMAELCAPQKPKAAGGDSAARSCSSILPTGVRTSSVRHPITTSSSATHPICLAAIHHW